MKRKGGSSSNGRGQRPPPQRGGSSGGSNGRPGFAPRGQSGGARRRGGGMPMHRGPKACPMCGALVADLKAHIRDRHDDAEAHPRD